MQAELLKMIKTGCIRIWITAESIIRIDCSMIYARLLAARNLLSVMTE